jgi:NitT/TauT family transport system ATP-binding protein
VFLANRVVVMAARPGRVYDVVEVDPAVVRDEAFRLSPEFAALRNRVWRSVYHQEGRTAALSGSRTDTPS